MPDRGTRPAVNVQLAADTKGRAIVGVEVTNAGSDAGQDAPMREQVRGRADGDVREHLIDGGYVDLADVDRAAAAQVALYMPVPEPRKEGVDRHRPKKGDSAAVAAWRERMGTEAAQATYRRRSSTIETVNGELKTERGLTQLRVRGLAK